MLSIAEAVQEEVQRADQLEAPINAIGSVRRDCWRLGGSRLKGSLDVRGLRDECLDGYGRVAHEASEDALLLTIDLELRFLRLKIRVVEWSEDVFDEADDALIWSLNSCLEQPFGAFPTLLTRKHVP